MQLAESAPTRRAVLGGVGALGAVSAAGGSWAQGAAAPKRIDIHHHFFSREWKQAEKAWADKMAHGYVYPGNASWTPEKTLEDMEQGGVSQAVLMFASIAGNWWGGDAKRASDIVRASNEYAAGLLRQYKGKFGLLAPLPMIDVDASLEEISFALDEVKADGIGLATSYGDKWPGDPMFDPIFAELNRRKAVVHFHPTFPVCCSQILPQIGGASVLEVPFDTVRCVANLLVTGTFAKYRDVTWIFAHGGGGLPSLSERIANFVSGGSFAADSPAVKAKLAKIAPNGVMAEFRRLYFDLANAAWPADMAGVEKLVPFSHMMFGSDFPYFSAAQNRDALMKLGLGRATLAAIFAGNAERLLPRLRTA